MKNKANPKESTFNSLEEFMRWSYLVSYLNIKYEDDYDFDGKRLELRTHRKVSVVEIKVVEDFCKRRKYTFEIITENNTDRIIIYLEN